MSKTIRLDWSDNQEDDLAGYYVYRDGARIATLGRVSEYTDNTIPDDALSVCYELVAVDRAQNFSPRSLSVCKHFPPSTPPYTISEHDGKLTITWDPAHFKTLTLS